MLRWKFESLRYMSSNMFFGIIFRFGHLIIKGSLVNIRFTKFQNHSKKRTVKEREHRSKEQKRNKKGREKEKASKDQKE